MSGWQSVDGMPKDGSPFLAYVKDWYARENRYHLLKMSINGYWDTAYTGDQTFERGDIIECQLLPKPSAISTTDHEPRELEG